MRSRGSHRTSLSCSTSLAFSGLRRARVASAAFAALIGLALPLAGANAGGPLYQWTDAQGNVHYTPDPDLVPSGQRGNLVIIEPAAPPTRAPARPALAPMPPAEPRVAAPAPVAQPIDAPPVEEAPTPSSAAPEAPAAAPPPVEAPRAAAPVIATPQLLAPPSDIPPAEAPPHAAPQSANESAGVTSAVAPTRAAESTPSSAQPPVAAPVAAPPADVALLEQQLKAAIAADQETLKSLLAAPTAPGATGLVDSPELRAIARRLPELQAQLRALREQPSPPAGP